VKARAALTASLAAAGLLLLTGCSTAISGTARAATHLPVTETTTSATELSETTESIETIDSKTPVPPTAPSTEPTEPSTSAIDADSVAWLSEFCYGFADVMQYAAPDTTGMTDNAALQTVVDAYDGMAFAASEAAQRLGAIAQPTFPGAGTVAPAIHDWLLAVSDVYSHGAQLIATSTFATEEDVVAAIDQIEASMNGANAEFGAAMGDIDPAVEAAVVELPECAALTG
jgi:hypothetical protein